MKTKEKEIDQNAVDSKLEKAEIDMLIDETFFAALYVRLDKRYVPADDNIQTMATDGRRLLINPKFVDSLEPEELKTVLIHEACHIAFKHPFRRMHREPRKWNKAADFEINNALDDINKKIKANGQTEPYVFPKGENAGLIDHSFDGKCAEEIYDLLSDEPDGGGGDEGGNDPGGMGETLDAEGTPKEQKELEQETELAIAQAAQVAQKQGKLPASIERMVEKLLNPPPKWREVLRRFVREVAKDDYSFARPNRRYISTGFYLPSLYSQRIGRIAVAVDTSGSITPEMINAFMSEVELICHECRPSKIVVFDCDAAIHSIREYDAIDPLPRDFAGGGGTDFRPVFDELTKQETPVCLIYFTDLYGSFPDNPPDYPVIWAVQDEGPKIPFGEIVKIDK
jgi:predicted metal-dependent peptidase